MINFSFSTHLSENYTPYSLSLEEFADVLKSNGNYSPFQYDNNYRKEIYSNLDKCNCIMLDFDDGLSINEAKIIFSEYKNIIATTRSHQKEKNGIICDRFRVILPTNRAFTDITIDEYKMMMKLLILRFGSDEATKDAARLYYAYEHSQIEINSNGFLFDIDILHRQAMYYFNKQKEIKEKEKETKKTGVNLNIIQNNSNNVEGKDWFYKFSHTEQLLNYFEFSQRWGAGGRNKFLYGCAKHMEEHNCDTEYIKQEILWINSQAPDPLEEPEIERTIFRSIRL